MVTEYVRVLYLVSSVVPEGLEGHGVLEWEVVAGKETAYEAGPRIEETVHQGKLAGKEKGEEASSCQSRAR